MVEKITSQDSSDFSDDETLTQELPKMFKAKSQFLPSGKSSAKSTYMNSRAIDYEHWD